MCVAHFWGPYIPRYPVLLNLGLTCEKALSIPRSMVYHMLGLTRIYIDHRPLEVSAKIHHASAIDFLKGALDREHIHDTITSTWSTPTHQTDHPTHPVRGRGHQGSWIQLMKRMSRSIWYMLPYNFAFYIDCYIANYNPTHHSAWLVQLVNRIVDWWSRGSRFKSPMGTVLAW